MHTDLGDPRCSYAIRVKREDGTEQLVHKDCPFLEACKEQGRSCVFPEVQSVGSPQAEARQTD